MLEVSESRAEWAIPWPCIHEFIGVVTHPRVFSPASTLAEAFAQIDAWRKSPGLVLISETADHWPFLKELASAARIAGPAIHDARIAAICEQHGVIRLLSADRDFSRFPALRVSNPLI